MLDPQLERKPGGVYPVGRRPTILVVDDARCSRELLKLHLGNAGYEVDVAEDAIVAGKRVLAAVPDLILTEVTLPYMSGIEFVTALRSDPGIPDIPVIFMTSREDMAFDKGKLRAAACLAKPVSVDRLLEVVALYVLATPPLERRQAD